MTSACTAPVYMVFLTNFVKHVFISLLEFSKVYDLVATSVELQALTYNKLPHLANALQQLRSDPSIAIPGNEQADKLTKEGA